MLYEYSDQKAQYQASVLRGVMFYVNEGHVETVVPIAESEAKYLYEQRQLKMARRLKQAEDAEEARKRKSREDKARYEEWSKEREEQAERDQAIREEDALVAELRGSADSIPGAKKTLETLRVHEQTILNLGSNIDLICVLSNPSLRDKLIGTLKDGSSLVQAINELRMMNILLRRENALAYQIIRDAVAGALKETQADIKDKIMSATNLVVARLCVDPGDEKSAMPADLVQYASPIDGYECVIDELSVGGIRKVFAQEVLKDPVDYSSDWVWPCSRMARVLELAVCVRATVSSKNIMRVLYNLIELTFNSGKLDLLPMNGEVDAEKKQEARARIMDLLRKYEISRGVKRV